MKASVLPKWLSATLILLLGGAISGIALADQISNDVDATVDTTLEIMNLTVGGVNGSVVYRMIPVTGGDGHSGCNFQGNETLVVAVNTSLPGVATVSPTSLTFNNCNDTKTVTVTPVGAGSSSITLSEITNNTGGDTFQYNTASFTVNVTAPPANGHIVVDKVTNPADAQSFNFDAVGGAYADFSLTNAALPNDQTLVAGSYSVSETVPAGWDQTSATCQSSKGDSETPGNISLQSGEIVTCTFTNTKRAKLTVTKVVTNDHGGSAIVGDFPLFIDNTSVTSGAQTELLPGSYTVSEAGMAGYMGTISGDCAPDGTVTLAPGDVKSCTITNDDIQPLLKITKIVTNNNGGSAVVADFPLFVDATSVTSGEQNGFNAGNYAISETNQPGYIGTIGGDCATDGSITLVPGDVKECTITNDDQPGTLIVQKVMVNDNGGALVPEDFSFSVNGDSSVAFEPDAENELTVDAGIYSVVEDAVAGYEASYSNCDSVAIPNGGTATCIVTNDDIAPELTIIKHVVTDDGGTAVASEFTMNVSGTKVSDDSFPGDETGITVTLDAGAYSVTESGGPAGYTESDSEDCSGSIAIGETKTCTITNDDQPGTLIVIKHVVNDNGGTAEADDFTMTVNGTNVAPSASFAGEESPGTTVTLDAGNYSVSESSLAGYAESDSTECSGTIANGETKTCTITNDDIQPKVIVIKHVINNNGGVKVAANFTMQVSGTNASPSSFAGAEAPGTSVALDAGNFSVSETPDAAYTMMLAGDCSGTIAIGETKTCTVTNDDKAPTRGQGFWATHKTYAVSKLGGSISIGTGTPKVIDSAGKLMGAFWSSIPYKSNGKTKRGNLDQSRMILVQQLVAAKLNCKAFGPCDAATIALITSADAAYSGTNTGLMTSFAGQLGTFNGSGEGVAIFPNPGAAEPTSSQAAADKSFWDTTLP